MGRGLGAAVRDHGLLNFLDSHDGAGLFAVRDLVPATALEHPVQKARKLGGVVPYRTEPDDNETPYEINITGFSALTQEDTDAPLSVPVVRFPASRAVAVVLRADVNRDINRAAVDYDASLEAFADPDSLVSRTSRGPGLPPAGSPAGSPRRPAAHQA